MEFNLSIINGTLRDVDSCVELLLQNEPWKTFGFSKQELSVRISQSIAGLYVVPDLKNSLIGFLLYKSNGFSGAPEVSLLCVSPKHQRMGIGRALMNKAEEMAFSSDKNLILRVSDFTGAKAFYEKLGFMECGIFKDWILPGKHELIMRKTLGPKKAK